MAVCLATTTGDSVDDDDVVELVREDDEVCLLDRAIITSYSPPAFHLQLNARSSFRGWLESRLNSPAADLYLARCSKGRSCDRCILASQITCAESHSPLCLACTQRSELYCSIFFRNPIPCRNWTDIQTREFETRVEYFVGGRKRHGCGSGSQLCSRGDCHHQCASEKFLERGVVKIERSD